MKESIYDRLWRRECGEGSQYASIRGIYGSKKWVDDLDIVNELGGHTGCVNALSWSRSGSLLASGSDDKHINLYSYQPDSSTAPFALNATVNTGHIANIFSVKFMPHSNDRTLVTCAGDSQVRVFDIEHANNAAATSAFTSSTRSQRFNNFFTGVRYLSQGNTNARTYRCHADSVKRIVTESSPYLFLTCSEDGEVRQWDLRQPSSAYPAPQGGLGFMSFRPGTEHDDSNVPPPLISYKRYNIDLNTISCSPSQPHYIALGGAHLHCFLHDRRMLGRDRLAERGDPGGSSQSSSSQGDEQMSQATRCVRRFAPNGKPRMKKRDNGHITACKISDANPNDMVVSWSGDHIYSFDLIRSADAREAEEARETSVQSSASSHRGRSLRHKKRKRQNVNSSSPSQSSGDRHQSRLRPEEGGESAEMSLRVRYGNGESENIPVPNPNRAASEEAPETAGHSVLSDAQRLGMRISKSLLKIRKALFSTSRAHGEVPVGMEFTLNYECFSSVLTNASICLPQMQEVMSSWRYPANPTEADVSTQQRLRRLRAAAWRFVQAAGTLTRVLRGELRDTPEAEGEEGQRQCGLDTFSEVLPAPAEDDNIDRRSQFCYDFLKAIFLWLDGGRQSLLTGFKHDFARRRSNKRFPIPEAAGDSGIEEYLIPYLSELASTKPVIDVDVSRFEHDMYRTLLRSQKAAVEMFSNAIKRPLEENTGDSPSRHENPDEPPNASNLDSNNRLNSTRFWAFEIGRGILLEAYNGLNSESVTRAFGGLHTAVQDDSDSESEPERVQEDIDPNEEEEPIRDIRVVASGHSPTGETADELFVSESQDDDSGSDDDEGSADGEDEDQEESESDEDDDMDVDDDVSDEDGSSDSEDVFTGPVRFHRSQKGNVESDVPCSSHTRVYRGHCNIKTVKDVNFFGLDDEYVTSGSDSGHIFIWDRKTSNLVNILEGDSEVVNVVQGHPYEPTIAASGIDNTIKIFSPDQRAQDDARQGINILDPDNPANTLGRHVEGVSGLQSRKRMSDSYRIINQNDVDRQGGLSEAFITRSMLSRLAANWRARPGGGVLFGEFGPTERATIVLDQNCHVM